MIHIKIKYIFLVLALIMAFASGVYLESTLTSSIAVVNLERILVRMPKLAEARQENETKLKELAQWIESVNKELDTEKDKATRAKLAEQYKNIAQEKEKLIKQNYDQKLKEIDVQITDAIERIAHKKGCNIVLSETTVVKGGQNITDDVINSLIAE